MKTRMLFASTALFVVMLGYAAFAVDAPTLLDIEQDLTLVTVPDADHWVQQDAPDLVSRSIRSWLTR